MPRPREFTESAVLESARNQFWETGYAGTSLADLTAATGLGKGSLYGAFGDKHALFLRTLEGYCADVVSDAHGELSGGGRAIDRLVEHLRNSARVGVVGARSRGCMMAKAAAEFGARDAAVQHIISSTFTLWHDELAAGIAKAQDEGDIAGSVDADTLAWTLLTVLRGFEAMRKAGVATDHLAAALDQVLGTIPRSG
ncbi:TetR/AcrR family transcriptional regulator [Rhodococcoides trifolii]|nr:TetR/AcrR family transcriptional regulator [Rhodococcus trifolii]